MKGKNYGKGMKGGSQSHGFDSMHGTDRTTDSKRENVAKNAPQASGGGKKK